MLLLFYSSLNSRVAEADVIGKERHEGRQTG